MPETMPGIKEIPDKMGENLTLASLQETAEVIRGNVGALKELINGEINKKLVDRETLIAEAQKNSVLLKEAKEAMKYFSEGDHLPKTENEHQIINALITQINELERQSSRQEHLIDQISSNPTVEGRIQEMAKQEYVDKVWEELNPLIYEFADKMSSSMRDHVSLNNYRLDEEADNVFKEISHKVRSYEKKFKDIGVVESEFKKKVFETIENIVSSRVQNREYRVVVENFLIKKKRELGI